MKRKLELNLTGVVLSGSLAIFASLAWPQYGALIVLAGVALEFALILENMRLSTRP